jgi:hypothetical protein
VRATAQESGHEAEIDGLTPKQAKQRRKANYEKLSAPNATKIKRTKQKT